MLQIWKHIESYWNCCDTNIKMWRNKTTDLNLQVNYDWLKKNIFVSPVQLVVGLSWCSAEPLKTFSCCVRGSGWVEDKCQRTSLPTGSTRMEGNAELIRALSDCSREHRHGAADTLVIECTKRPSAPEGHERVNKNIWRSISGGSHL